MAKERWLLAKWGNLTLYFSINTHHNLFTAWSFVAYVAFYWLTTLNTSSPVVMAMDFSSSPLTEAAVNDDKPLSHLITTLNSPSSHFENMLLWAFHCILAIEVFSRRFLLSNSGRVITQFAVHQMKWNKLCILPDNDFQSRACLPACLVASFIYSLSLPVPVTTAVLKYKPQAPLKTPDHSVSNFYSSTKLHASSAAFQWIYCWNYAIKSVWINIPFPWFLQWIIADWIAWVSHLIKLTKSKCNQPVYCSLWVIFWRRQLNKQKNNTRDNVSTSPSADSAKGICETGVE